MINIQVPDDFLQNVDKVVMLAASFLNEADQQREAGAVYSATEAEISAAFGPVEKLVTYLGSPEAEEARKALDPLRVGPARPYEPRSDWGSMVSRALRDSTTPIPNGEQ